MTQKIWDMTPRHEKARLVNNSMLTAQLVGLEGKRVEVEDDDGKVRSFHVGKSTGWIPVHIELDTNRSIGGYPAQNHYKTVRVIP